MLKREWGRAIPESLRVSLTNRCNYDCRFCHKEGELCVRKKSDMDSANFISFLSFINSNLSKKIENLSFTGGEPLLHPELHQIIIESKALGVKNISITTNGSLLNVHGEELLDLPIDELHISLNTLNKNKFYYLIRKKAKSYYFERIMNCLDNELYFRDNRLKIVLNTILFEGKDINNIIELNDFIDFANSRGFLIIFWEVLKCNSFSRRNFFEISNLFDILEHKIALKEPYRWFNIYILDDGRKFGVAKCLCSNFCIDKPSQKCDYFNSLHITPDLRIKKCMFSTKYIRMNYPTKQNNTKNTFKFTEYTQGEKNVRNKRQNCVSDRR